MIQRWVVLGAVVVAVAGCSPSVVKHCSTQSDCRYPGSVCMNGVCSLPDDAGAGGGTGGGATGGGTGGGSATGGGTGGGSGGSTGGGTGGGTDDAGIDAGPPPCTTNQSCGGGAHVCGADGGCFVDITPPTVAFTSPDGGALLSTATVTVTGTASDLQSGLATVELSTDGTTFTPVTLTGSQFTKDFPVPAVQATPFTVTARATDVAGLMSTATLTLTADRVGPTIAITTPATDGSCGATSCNGALVNLATGANYSVSGTVVDPGGVASASLRILDGASVLVPATALALGPSGAWTYSWTSLPTVNGRAYVVEVTAKDLAGNAGAPVTRTVLVDRVPPTATFTSPTPGALLNTASVTLAGTAGDGSSYGVSMAESSLDGTTWTPVTLAADGSFSAPLAVPTVDHVAQTLSLRVTDLLGNAKIFTVGYVADRVAPVVAFTSPSADDSCASLTTWCAGAVANSTNTSYAVIGSLSEGGGVSSVALTFDVFNPTTNTVLESSTPAAASPWNASWTVLPTGVNGHEYQFRVTATDAAGNSSGTVVRKIWLDNVKPTASMLLNNARLVTRTANLVTFSEPMVTSATLSAMSFTPPLTITTLGPDAAGTTYAFTGTDLVGYTSYTLSVGTGASDRAGNPLAAPVSEKFLTQTVMPRLPVVLKIGGSCVPAHPRVAVDADGRPAVAMACGGANGPVVTSFPGNGSGTPQQALSVDPTGTWFSVGEFQVLPNNGTLLADLTRPLGYRFTVPYTTSGGGNLEYVERSATGSWTRADGTTGYDTFFPALARSTPFFEILPATSGLGGGPEVLRVGGLSNSGTLVSRVYSGTWATNTVAAISGLVEETGAAVLTFNGSTYTITYFDSRGSSAITSGAFAAEILHPAGEAQRMSYDGIFGNTVAMTPAFVAWAMKAGGTGAGAWAGVNVACTMTPTAATPGWRATNTALAYGAAAQPALKVATALNTLSFVAAVDLNGSVSVVSTPSSGTCAAAPVVTVVGTIPAASDPGVAIDSSGVIWVAYADTATGNLMLTHF